jgi:hypothetical protein
MNVNLSKLTRILERFFKRTVRVIKVDISKYNEGEMEVTFYVKPK